MNTFSIKEAIKFGSKTTTDNLKFFVLLILLTSFVPQIIINGGQEMQHARAGIIGTIIVFAGYFMSALLNFNSIKVFLGYIDGIKMPFKTLVDYDARLWRYIGATALYTLIVIGGLILLIIPGIVWSIKYSYFSYGIADKNLGIKASLKYSADLTKDRKWKLLGFFLVLCGLNILGAFALMVGLLFTMPVTMLAYAFVYRKLARVTDQVVLHTDTAPAIPSSVASVTTQ